MSNKQTFSTRIGFLLSVLGIAIGTGNIWRFPRIAASNGNEDGAGAFIFAWIIMLFLWSVPLIIAEYLLGKKYRKSVVGSFLSSLGGRFTWMGSFIALVTAAICLFYAVIVGWCIYYFFHMLVLNIPQSTEQSFLIWNNFQNSSWPLFFHALAISFGAMVIWKGVSSIE